ncbi:unnamed protein product [Citrullus colocynthis]|uniref:Uncharacterized protein n=1 Tax=Citrullus colocynthis TaxID=252529 RepID=A0ABP0YZK0_9ROSI
MLVCLNLENGNQKCRMTVNGETKRRGTMSQIRRAATLRVQAVTVVFVGGLSWSYGTAWNAISGDSATASGNCRVHQRLVVVVWNGVERRISRLYDYERRLSCPLKARHGCLERRGTSDLATLRLRARGPYGLWRVFVSDPTSGDCSVCRRLHVVVWRDSSGLGS